MERLPLTSMVEDQIDSESDVELDVWIAALPAPKKTALLNYC